MYVIQPDTLFHKIQSHLIKDSFKLNKALSNPNLPSWSNVSTPASIWMYNVLVLVLIAMN